MEKETLSSLVYEAAVVPERWSALLDGATDYANAFGGALFTVGRETNFGLFTPSLNPLVEDMVAGGWDKLNPRPAYAMASGRTRFMHDAQVVPPEEMATHPFYTVFCKRWDLGGSLGTQIEMPGGGNLFLTLERHIKSAPYSDVEVEMFDALWPDLSRAVELQARLLFQQYQTTTGILNAVGIASAVITSKRKLLAANDLFADLMPGMMQDRASGLVFTAKSANELFDTAFGRLAPASWVGVTASIPVAAVPNVHPAAIAHVLPIRGVAHDIVHGGAALIIVSTISQNTAPADTMLRSLFDLTAAEARVASALIRNLGNYIDVASDLGLSRETVKTHSKAIYQKAGISGAVELISLVGSIKVAET